jgi:sugar phosphate isomerase/epimerase
MLVMPRGWCQHPAMNTRRRFLRQSAASAVGALGFSALAQQAKPGDNISFGLVTYMLGAEWDIPTIIKNLKTLNMGGVELRVDHAHKVSPMLSNDERAKVKSQFEDSGVELVGLGTNWKFDSPNKEEVRTNLGEAKMWIQLSHDVGGSGVKVKPDRLHEKEGIPKDQTLEQIGKALAELGDYAVGFGQEIRLEVHGQVTNLGDVRKVMQVADRDNVRVCWNSNMPDLEGEGIEKNFDLVKQFFGRTVHVHDLRDDKYPFDKLAKLLVAADYDGWVLSECSSKDADKFKALGEQKAIWDKHMAAARATS